MEPKHSILYFKQQLIHHKQEICRFLNSGMKVFWFGSAEDAAELKQEFRKFSQDFFLQVYEIQEIPSGELLPGKIIVDGEGIQENEEEIQILDWLEKEVPAFNVAQYKVEHCKADANIVVKASAGTGKTTVMIDRILYLMHRIPDLKMSDIYMITFTNEATNQMNDRLQEMLLKKYALTKNKRYLSWLEQQSQMHISTIDSLAYDLFRRFGTSVGFGRDLGIQPLEKERKDLIKDILSDQLDDGTTIFSQMGMSYSEASRLIDKYWKELTRKGYTISEILEKDWGENPDDPFAAGFQRILKAVLGQFEEKYRKLKLDSNAVTINDLFFDFGHYLLEEKLNCDGLEMRYLFVDEFQDTDGTQIRTFARLVQRLGAHLFAVGDVKQSIYSFKGATDAAFDILEEEMRGKITYFSLRNNYRTCSNLMKVLEEYFFTWAEEGLLQYEESVRPLKNEMGMVQMDLIENKNSIPAQTIALIEYALQDLEMEIRSGKKKVTDKTKVAVLVRGNGEDEVGALALGVVLHHLELTGDVKQGAVGKLVGAQVVVKAVGIVQPAVGAHHHSAVAALGGDAKELLVNEGAQGNELVAQGRMAFEVIAKVLQHVLVDAAVFLEQGGVLSSGAVGRLFACSNEKAH